ncbi:MAG: hypothetical protein ACQEQ4_04290 [Fibrobacterota bacterium]
MFFLLVLAGMFLGCGVVYSNEHAIMDQDQIITQDPSNPVISDSRLDLQDHDFSQRDVDLGTGAEFAFGKKGTYLTIPIRYAPFWAPGFSIQSYIPVIFGKEHNFDQDTSSGVGDISLRVTYFRVLNNKLHFGGGLSTVLPTGKDYVLGGTTLGFNTNITALYLTKSGVMNVSAYYSWRLDHEDEYDTLPYPRVWSFNQGYKQFLWKGLSFSAFSKVSIVHNDVARDTSLVLWDASPSIAYETQIPIINSVYFRTMFPLLESDEYVDREISHHVGFNSFF